VECLEKVLPDPPLPSEVLSPRPRRERFDRAAMAGFAAVAICSALPWNRFGVGEGAFGAWGVSPWRWSSPIGPLAIAGLIAAFLASRPARPVAPVGRAALSLAIGAVLLALSLLAIAHPPVFSHANAVPWVAAGLALVLLVLSAWVLTNRLKWAKRSAA
jgi:uncharacterized protein DUF418